MTDLPTIQKNVDELAQELGGYWQPLSMYARLAEEVGEVGRVMNHTFGDKPPKRGESAGDLGAELADVLLVLCCIANTQKIDLATEITQVIAKNATRDKDRFATGSN